MNLSAFEILEQLKLYHPKTYILDEVLNLLDDSRIYLRYIEGYKDRNCIVYAKKVKANLEFYKSQKEQGILIQIAEAVNSNAGCVIYFGNGFVYGEYIEGEPIGLLRRGLCGKRFLLKKNDGNLYIKDCFQNWICKNENNLYKWLPYNGIISNSFLTIVNGIKEIKDLPEKKLIIEINLEGDRLIFTDARYRSLGIVLSEIIQMFENINKIINLKGNCIDLNKNNFKIDGFDIDNCSCIENNIVINNGALLSHYITYNINTIKNINMFI